MIGIAATIALNANSIVDAVIIATVIGTTSYFFPIIGGLYWKRGTRWGAMAALIAGGGVQILLVSYEQFWLRQPLDSISPYLTEHGVLVGLALSALFFFGVSLATPPEPDIRLAPFFADIAEKVFGRDMPRVDRKSARYIEIVPCIEETTAGDRSHLNLAVLHACAKREDCRQDQPLPWEGFVERLQERHPLWFTPTGSHIVYRLSQADMLACIKMVRGDMSHIWLSAEPRLEQTERLKDELFLAYEEIEDALAGLGIKAASE
jgi:SSS family solute:Na+ symporter